MQYTELKPVEPDSPHVRLSASTAMPTVTRNGLCDGRRELSDKIMSFTFQCKHSTSVLNYIAQEVS